MISLKNGAKCDLRVTPHNLPRIKMWRIDNVTKVLQHHIVAQNELNTWVPGKATDVHLRRYENFVCWHGDMDNLKGLAFGRVMEIIRERKSNV